tara:strand:- start:397 stop:801 length:405 start_codon:yes stop_codon:yes gene_type:complete
MSKLDSLREHARQKEVIIRCRHCGENGDWRIDNRNAKLYLSKVIDLLSETQIIEHEDIAWGMKVRKHWRGLRYDKCDISYPGIICKDAPNPYGKKYRLIDGNHRMAKMTNMNITKSPYYVVEYAILKPYFIYTL